MNYFLNPTIMKMANDLNIEYARLCGIFAIIDSIDSQDKLAMLKTPIAATLLGLDDGLPCPLDMLIGARDTCKYSEQMRW